MYTKHFWFIVIFFIVCAIDMQANHAVEKCDSVFDRSSGLYFSVTDEITKEAKVAMSASSTVNMNSYPELSGEVLIPESVIIRDKVYTVTTVGYHAFRGNRTISSVILPESIREIQGKAFYNCAALERISLPEGLEIIGDGVFGSSALKFVEIPETVISLGAGAFSCCRSLKEFVWKPECESTLSNRVLAETQVSDVVLGRNIRKLDDYSLGGISGLETLTVLASDPPELEGFPFDKTSLALTTLCVPHGVEKEYSETDGWKALGFLEIDGIDNVIRPQRISISCDRTYFIEGEEDNIYAIVYPANSDSRDVSWMSSDDSVLEIDQYGNVRANGVGKVVITAYCKYYPNVVCQREFTVMRSNVPKEYVYVTVKTSESGGAVFRYKKFDDVIIEILPSEGYEIESVTVNGQDLTSSLDHSTLGLGKISESKIIRVVFRETAGMNDTQHISRIKVISGTGVVKVCGLSGGESISVYDIEGRLVGKIEKAVSSEIAFELSEGNYIIMVTDNEKFSETYKTMI